MHTHAKFYSGEIAREVNLKGPKNVSWPSLRGPAIGAVCLTPALTQWMRAGEELSQGGVIRNACYLRVNKSCSPACRPDEYRVLHSC